MSWLKKISQLKPIVLYHATIPEYAELIIDQGAISPSDSVGNAGWAFDIVNMDYGNGVYLAKTQELALYYAAVRLRKIWEELEDYSLIESDEDYRFLALFAVTINNKKKLIIPQERYSKPKGFSESEEFMFLGSITTNPSDGAFFSGPQWINYEKEADEYVRKMRQIDTEFEEGFNQS